MKFLCIALIGLIGCGQTAVVKPPVDTVGFLADLSKIDAQSVEILVQTACIEGSIGELATQQKRIADAVETLKASLVESKAVTGEEVINPSRTAPSNNANDSQIATTIVAEPRAVRLLVSLAPFACPPCDQLKQAIDAGEFDAFAVEYSDDWKPRAYPAIRYPLASSPTGWAVIYGYDDTTINRLQAATNPVVNQARNTTAVMSHAQQVAEHNRLHGGGNWTWPGSTPQSLQSHLVNFHGVGLNASTNSTVSRYHTQETRTKKQWPLLRRYACPTCPR
jgi:hypothetical protein